MLLEVATAVQHLHGLRMLHCDIKPENVLLKSEPSNELGYVTKLTDFGALCCVCAAAGGGRELLPC